MHSSDFDMTKMSPSHSTATLMGSVSFVAVTVSAIVFMLILCVALAPVAELAPLVEYAALLGGLPAKELVVYHVCCPVNLLLLGPLLTWYQSQPHDICKGGKKLGITGDMSLFQHLF